jgi:hypothetical protein
VERERGSEGERRREGERLKLLLEGSFWKTVF